MTERFFIRNEGAGTVILDGEDDYAFEVVGESNYQDVLSEICGGACEEGVNHECAALLVLDNGNPFDENAVAVMVEGHLIGYVPRPAAKTYREAMKSLNSVGAAVGCRAVIRGGWDRGGDDVGSFGVRLDVALPYRLMRTEG